MGIACWIAYALIGIGALIMSHYATESDLSLLLIALGIALVIVVNLFALIGFVTGCSSLASERREPRGFIGLLINVVALWPAIFVLLLLIFGIR